MLRIFVTGDKHGSLELKHLSNKNWPLARELTRDDVVIICGDTGCMWDDSNETRYWDDWLEDRPFTTITCFGNHENYDKIRSLPREEWNGAIVRKVRPHVMYVENGEIFTLNDQTFFVMGGATSVDKVYRTEGKSWWATRHKGKLLPVSPMVFSPSLPHLAISMPIPRKTESCSIKTLQATSPWNVR
ncbi:MAG: metallophosphatase family protein [Prevotella sp.]|nr:metallophosphatase family protein [Prevotella sp.]